MSALAQFIKFAAVLGLKRRPALSDLAQSSATVAQIPNWNGTSWEAQSVLENMTVERSGKDSNNLYVTVKHKRPNGTVHRQSVLSGGVSPAYTTRTVTYYGADGVTAIATNVYALVYSGSDIISETLQ